MFCANPKCRGEIPSGKAKACPVCLSIKYCGRPCQKAHAKEHKKKCAEKGNYSARVEVAIPQNPAGHTPSHRERRGIIGELEKLAMWEQEAAAQQKGKAGGGYQVELLPRPDGPDGELTPEIFGKRLAQQDGAGKTAAFQDMVASSASATLEANRLRGRADAASAAEAAGAKAAIAAGLTPVQAASAGGAAVPLAQYAFDDAMNAGKKPKEALSWAVAQATKRVADAAKQLKELEVAAGQQTAGSSTPWAAGQQAGSSTPPAAGLSNILATIAVPSPETASLGEGQRADAFFMIATNLLDARAKHLAHPNDKRYDER